ncbi:DNA cytosine methyltransferase [Kitasatospora sp. NPDC092948]|uniref:DNA cytosine methyltransferase n=1 Tax=Kitasatospora sp. NPDC092948 TaxID=3364088 RepID=UPI0037F58B08
MVESRSERLSCLAVCAGAGGLALGLEQAGFDPVLLLDNRSVACETLRLNRPAWNVLEMDLLDFDPFEHQAVYDVDLLAAGLPRVKGSATAMRADSAEELRVLEATIMLLHGVQPRALLLENVAALAFKPAYQSIRDQVAVELEHLGYGHQWYVVDAKDHGVPQGRKQGVLVALKGDAIRDFVLPEPREGEPVTVGEALGASMAARGWPHAEAWAEQATEVAPTLVGGSWNRGGPDLGMAGSKRAWARMRVNGATVANQVPGPEVGWDTSEDGGTLVPLTVEQAAVLQGFPEEWSFAGPKTLRYRQVGHASPPPVARALGLAIRAALGHGAPAAGPSMT